VTASSTSSVSRSAAELRRAFLDFFVQRGHTLVPSGPLVPNDPSLLFTTAGMVPFKPYYTAGDDVPYTRAVSVQKCLRLSDLEQVGLTPRHCTFFEMLGNFSFGPPERGAYFKEEAIAMAWEFVTRILGLPRGRLYASVFAGEGALPRDGEAEALWKRVGLPADHVVALGRADNFWGPAGGQGPCGPCSEIYFDLGTKRPADLPEGAFWGERPGDAGDRFMEFWNLVFPQFDAQPDGTLRPLPRPGIDTGMGLERLALLMQEKPGVFETDLFEPLVSAVLARAAPEARRRAAARRDARVIADHARALTFAVAEGALPGNEGAGYVLRRLLRRAVVRGHSRRGLALADRYFLTHLAAKVREMFGGHYAELGPREPDVIHAVLAREEEHFTQTYEAGLALLETLLGPGATSVPGEKAFELHDTYGFPFELTEEIAAERGVSVDREGFERAMEAQRARARAASRFARAAEGPGAPWTEVTAGPDSEFLGYATLAASGLVLRRWRASPDGTLELVLDRTPAYAEAGGQVADRGRLRGRGVEAELVHVYREGESIVHRVRPAGDGERLLAAGAAGELEGIVLAEHRRPTMRHHTATHLLHATLRHVLGTHVRQAGSLVAPDRLRFDYTHFEAPTRAQLDAIEALVNEWIQRNLPVASEVMPLGRARETGAMALFGEKYGAEVRVVTVPGVEEAGIPASRELCGGTHVGRTGDLGAFALVQDAAIASGVRRLEALSGHPALDWLRDQSRALHEAAGALQVRPEKVPEQVAKLQGELERLRRAQAEAQRGELEAEMAELATRATAARQGRWVAARLSAEGDAGAAREAADHLRRRLGRGAAVVAFASAGKPTFLAVVSDDLVAEKRLRADELVRKVAQVAGGTGGGKPHLALGGARDPAKVEAALAEGRRLLEEALA
jgi:alanyl-tRNA synthetase